MDSTKIKFLIWVKYSGGALCYTRHESFWELVQEIVEIADEKSAIADLYIDLGDQTAWSVKGDPGIFKKGLKKIFPNFETFTINRSKQWQKL